MEEIVSKVVHTFGISEKAELREAREKLYRGPMTIFIKGFDRILNNKSSEYFADSRLTVADLSMFIWVKSLKSGNLDYIPTDLVPSLAPTLENHYQLVKNSRGVKDYYEAKKVSLP